MFRRLLLTPLALGGLLATAAAPAQTLGLNWNPRTGDVWVDSQLADVNRYGSTYREPFIDEMVRYHAAPRDLVTELLVNRHWSPGDVYYACNIAQVIGRPCRYVADQWQQDRGQGWGVLARRMGIKPGSAEFHRLKSGFVPTYDRWSRPITLDSELRRAYPNRGKTGDARTTHGSSSHGNPHSSAGPVHHGESAGKGATHGNAGSSHGKGQGHGKGKH